MKAQTTIQNTLPANKSWEIAIWIFGITVLALVFVNNNALAANSDSEFEEETYINDIPFDTEWVVNEMTNPEFDFEDEAYIDDIPFNTACVAADCKYKKAISVVFELEDENYIDDIPFDTFVIAKNSDKEKNNLYATGK